MESKKRTVSETLEVDPESITRPGKKRVANFDIFDDEKKPLSLKQFAEILRGLATDFEGDFDREGVSEFMKSEHTFQEWMQSFARWMSF